MVAVVAHKRKHRARRMVLGNLVDGVEARGMFAAAGGVDRKGVAQDGVEPGGVEPGGVEPGMSVLRFQVVYEVVGAGSLAF